MPKPEATTPNTVSMSRSRQPASSGKRSNISHHTAKNARLLSTMNAAWSQNAPRSARLARRFIAMSARRNRAVPFARAISASAHGKAQSRAMRQPDERAADHCGPDAELEQRLERVPRVEAERGATGSPEHRRERREPGDRAQPVRIHLERQEQPAEHERELLPDPVDRAGVDDPERR